MIFSLHHVINSLAELLSEGYPEYPVYDSPNQQGTSFPCFFIFYMPSTIEDQIGNRYLRDLGVDIVFVQQRNLANGNQKIHEIADFLDRNLERFPAYSFHPNDNRATVVIPQEEFLKYLAAVGNSYEFIELY